MLPKYVSVQLDLQQKIDSGKFKPGEAIPSERQLTDHYAVSRITVRRAIAELIAKSQLETIQGKGTFVCHRHSNLDIVPLTSCSEDIVRMGLTVSKHIVESGIVTDSDNIHGFAGHKQAGGVYKLSRIFCGDGEPINYTEAFINISYFPGLEKHDFELESLYDVLHYEYGLTLTRARRLVEATHAPERIARYLDVKKNMPILLFRCVTQGMLHGQEITFERYSSWYRSDKYAFYIDQSRLGGGGDT